MKLSPLLISRTKSYDKPRQHIKKQRHYFANKGLSSQSYGFSSSHGWMWELGHKEGWAPKNWCAFELWCWRRLLWVPWTARRSNQSILKEINPEHSLEGLMLKLQYFGHLMQRVDSLEKTLMLGKIEAGGEGDNRGWDGWMASLTRWTWVWLSPGSWWWTERPGVCSLWGRKELYTTEQLKGTDWSLGSEPFTTLLAPYTGFLPHSAQPAWSTTMTWSSSHCPWLRNPKFLSTQLLNRLFLTWAMDAAE